MSEGRKPKRKPRESWATRPLPPITLAEIDRHLDFVATCAARWPDRAELLLPIWRILEREHEKQRVSEETMSRMMARARLVNQREVTR